jgi:hypothetical protein
MQALYELEDFAVGEVVLTPSGRRAIVVRLLTGASKRDCFSRVMVRYEGGKRSDLVTLQPHQLRHAPPSTPVHRPSIAQYVQLSFAFA